MAGNIEGFTKSASPIGRLLNHDDRQVVLDRFQIMLAMQVMSENLDVDNTIHGFKNMALSLECAGTPWFHAYMHLLQAQKSLTLKTAIGIMGLQPIDRVALALLEQINIGKSFLPGTPFDQVAVITFHMAHSVILEARQKDVLARCMEMLTLHHTSDVSDSEFKMARHVLRILRIRLNPGGQEGTVKKTGNNIFVTWTTPADSKNAHQAGSGFDVVTPQPDQKSPGADMVAQPA